jgi:hypothetical protein
MPRFTSSLRVAASAAAVVAFAPAAHASYVDAFTGAFGSMSFAYAAGRSTEDGGSLHFLSSQTAETFVTRYNVPGILFSASSSSSLLDGTLHADALAGSCAPSCYFGSNSSIAGGEATLWEHVTVVGGTSDQLIPMRLRIDGTQGGLGYGQIRYYVGNQNPFTVWNRTLSQGWQVLGQSGQRDVDVVIDLGSVGAYGSFGIYIDLDTYAGSIMSGTSFADFGHTVHFEWDLPQGVTFTSASGQFMTAAVPEPGTWALMLGGLAAVGRLARRRLS